MEVQGLERWAVQAALQRSPRTVRAPSVGEGPGLCGEVVGPGLGGGWGRKAEDVQPSLFPSPVAGFTVARDRLSSLPRWRASQTALVAWRATNSLPFLAMARSGDRAAVATEAAGEGDGVRMCERRVQKMGEDRGHASVTWAQRARRKARFRTRITRGVKRLVL